MVLGFERGAFIGGVYRVIEVLGHGGMGVVLHARDEQLERDVAIKVVRPELLNDGMRERFLAEARAMARVSHPNVLPVYAFGEHEGAPYFVTQLVRGPTAENWLRARPLGTAPDLEIAFKIIEETCCGVAAVHAADTVHRDLKPSNLLLDANFGVRVADMGVAALVWSERARGGIEAHELVGTPEYMAPEAVLQLAVTSELAPRADVYALGCLAFELLTGTAPFTARTTVGRMMAHVNDAPQRLSARRPGLPSELDDVLLEALAKDPAERTASADAFRRGIVGARAKTRAPARILVADDDDDFREVLGLRLRQAFPDTEVELVSDGQAAVEAFENHRHSAAIVDLQMPRIGGWELIELLRARPDARNVPIIVLTGSGGPAEWRRLSELGADGFLVKPVNVEDVATILRRVLAARGRNTPLPARPPHEVAEHEAETVLPGRPRIVGPEALAATDAEPMRMNED